MTEWDLFQESKVGLTAETQQDQQNSNMTKNKYLTKSNTFAD